MTRRNIDLKINYIELPASDFDAVESFYHQAFDWHFEDYGSEYRAFHDDRLDGGFYRSDNCSVAAGGAALVILYALDLESARERVIAAGGAWVRIFFPFPEAGDFIFWTRMAMSWLSGAIPSQNKRRAGFTALSCLCDDL